MQKTNTIVLSITLALLGCSAVQDAGIAETLPSIAKSSWLGNFDSMGERGWPSARGVVTFRVAGAIGLALSPSGRFLAIKSRVRGRYALGLWSVVKRRRIWRRLTFGVPASFGVSDCGQVASVEYNPTGLYNAEPLIEGSSVVIVYSNAGKQIARIKHYAALSYGVQFSADNKCLFIGDSYSGNTKGQCVNMYHVHDWKQVRRFTGFEWGHVADIAISKDGSRVAAATIAGESLEGELCIWRISTGSVEYSSREKSDIIASEIQRPVSFLSDEHLLCGNHILNIIKAGATPIISKVMNSPGKLIGGCSVGKRRYLIRMDKRDMRITRISTAGGSTPEVMLQISASPTYTSCARTRCVVAFAARKHVEVAYMP